ncbi:MAG: hypothetical protein HY517_04495 [Candidatus Aenigmarchaeota archaeon]|nr:hypothetical protein [Candidatus Aenigmarchaeota archaeon]
MRGAVLVLAGTLALAFSAAYAGSTSREMGKIDYSKAVPLAAVGVFAYSGDFLYRSRNGRRTE